MPITDVKHGIISRRTEGSFRYHAWGSIAKLTDGTIAAACSAGRNWHIDAFGKTFLWLSKDEGETWSCPIIVNDTWMDDRDVGLTALPNGGLMLTWFTTGFELLDERDNSIKQAMSEGEYELMKAYQKTCIENPDVVRGRYCRVSHDGGLTWSEPRPTPCSSPHGPTVMNDGSLLYFGRAAKATEAWRSTDEGKTWEFLGAVPVPEGWSMRNFFEPHALQLPNGRIVGIIRFENTIPEQFEKYYALSMFATYSDDGGKTWSVPENLGYHGAPPHLMLHSSGALICAYGRRDDGTRWYDLSERALVSWDNGETWAEDLTIFGDGPDWDLGYPSSVELSDGSILTAYYQKYQDENNGRKADDKCSFLYTKWRLTKE